MHREPAAVVVQARPTVWHVGLKTLLCVSCLLAGAALVTMSSPLNWLVAQSGGAAAGGDTVLLDFTASWCGPCREMSPIIDRLAAQGYPVRKVDVDQQRQIAEHYRVTSMPTFVLVVNGREVMRQSGVTSEAQLRRMLLQIPAWQQELAAQANPPRRDLQQTPANSRDDDFAPSPFAIDLGNARNHLDSPAADRSRATHPGSTPSGNSLAVQVQAISGPRAAVLAGGGTVRDNGPVVRGQSAEAANPAGEIAVGDPMLASTRLRVKDSQGMNFGSGTILESRVGRTVILTCGHIFRHLDQQGLVEVDVYLRGQKPITYVGKVIQFDEQSDVGLVAIPTTERLPFMPLASINSPVQVGDSVISIGCGGGENPSRETVEVTAVNKYTGPDNIECTGFPIQGRSGGGLFRGKELVGVCIAADPKDRRGVYTGLTPIYELLEKSGFGHILPVGRPEVVAEVPPATPRISDQRLDETPAATSPFGESAFATNDAPSRSTLPSATPGAAMSTTGDAADGFEEFAAAALVDAQARGTATTGDLEKVLEQAPDSEVICIVRPKNPKIPSRVVIIHQASPKLVGYLLDTPGSKPAEPKPEIELLSRAESLIPTAANAATLARSSQRAGQPREVTPISVAPTRPSSPRLPFLD